MGTQYHRAYLLISGAMSKAEKIFLKTRVREAYVSPANEYTRIVDRVTKEINAEPRPEAGGRRPSYVDTFIQNNRTIRRLRDDGFSLGHLGKNSWRVDALYMYYVSTT